MSHLLSLIWQQEDADDPLLSRVIARPSERANVSIVDFEIERVSFNERESLCSNSEHGRKFRAARIKRLVIN